MLIAECKLFFFVKNASVPFNSTGRDCWCGTQTELLERGRKLYDMQFFVSNEIYAKLIDPEGSPFFALEA